MIIFGAVDFTAALARAGKLLGYRVTVCDARAVFATPVALPDGRRGRERLAGPVPGQGRRRARTTRRGVRAHPRPQVRRARDRRRARRPTSGTSARWVRGGPTRTGSSGSARPASTTPGSPASWRRSASTSAPAPRRRPPIADLRRDHRVAHRTPAPRRCATAAGPIHG